VQVLAYPCKFSGDKSALPIVKTKGGADLLLVEFGNHVTDELIDLFIRASKRGCQWVELCDAEPVRIELTWRDI
jgi:hypothetical protein